MDANDETNRAGEVSESASLINATTGSGPCPELGRAALVFWTVGQILFSPVSKCGKRLSAFDQVTHLIELARGLRSGLPEATGTMLFQNRADLLGIIVGYDNHQDFVRPNGDFETSLDIFQMLDLEGHANLSSDVRTP